MKTLFVFGLAFLLVLAVVGVSVVSAASNTYTNNARQIVDRAPDGDTVISILLYYDMEGLSGQNIVTSIDFPRPEYFEARELLTNDVNAVIAGLCAGGADEITVVDAHGSFNPEPDILVDKMDPRARMIARPAKFDPYADLPLTDHCDAVVAVGMHSRTGGGGFAEHTINLGNEWIFNDMPLNESEILAYSWGRAGVPLIMVTGDNKLAEQCAWMDWMEYVTVKDAAGIDDAVLRPVDEVHAEMRVKAEQAIKHLDRAKVVKLSTPIVATLHVVPPADLSILEKVPGLDYHDQSVTFRAADFKEAYDGMRGLLAAAQSGYYDIAAGLLFKQDSGFTQFKDAVLDVWVSAAKAASEPPQDSSGTASSPAQPKKEQVFFGSR